MVDATLETALEEFRLVELDQFESRVQDEVGRLRGLVSDGVFDNPQALTGLEYEFYAVRDPLIQDDTHETPGALARVPRRLLEFIRFENELGLHNAELATNPLPLNGDGIVAQEATISAQLTSALESVRTEGLRLVSDGMWTIPPSGETATDYLTASVKDQGYRIASNMSASPRYHSMADPPGTVSPAMRIEAPHVAIDAETVMPESLITSIQPHYQVPRAEHLPRYFRAALRVAGPLVSLGANAPFFPPDMYDDVEPERILADGFADHRIQVFESVMNDPDSGTKKVRFPEDIGTVTDAIERIATDPVMVPLESESAGRFDDQFGNFRAKTGTFWRWVRPVFDGATRSAANARIEFRPLSAQPTVRDSVGFLAAFAGLMEALPARDHPVMDLPWEEARDNFYTAARSGLGAELTWRTIDGTTPSSSRRVYDDLLDQAAEGLRIRGCSEELIGRYLGPLRRRVRHWQTPAGWSRRRVREQLDRGDSFAEAVTAMKKEYLYNQAMTLLNDDFTAWIDGGPPNGSSTAA